MSQDTGDGAWVSAATQRLVILLEAAASESTRQHWTRYLKGAATFRGVPMAGVRSAVATVVRDGDLMSRSEDELLGLSHTWLARQDTEDKLAAVLLLAEHLGTRLRTEHDLQLATPLAKGDVADWNVCDWYATRPCMPTSRPTVERMPGEGLGWPPGRRPRTCGDGGPGWSPSSRSQRTATGSTTAWSTTCWPPAPAA